MVVGVVSMLIASGCIAANQIKRSFVATYAATTEGLDAGMLTFILSEDKVGFTATSTLEPSPTAQALGGGRLEQISRFRIEQGRVLPDSFNETRTGAKARKWALAFDWEAGIVTTDRGDRFAIPRRPVDRNTALIQLMLTPPAKIRELLSGMVCEKGDRPYFYRYRSEQRVETALGSLKTITVRQRKKGSAEHKYLDIWLAVDRHYIPVRFERHKAGRVVTLEVRSIK